MLTTEDLPDGQFGLNIWCNGYWERHQFKTLDEREIFEWKCTKTP